MNRPPAVVIFLHAAKRVDKVLPSTVQRFVRRLEHGDNPATRPATIRGHGAEIWNDLTPQSRKGVAKKVYDDFGVDLGTLRNGEQFGQWLAESWDKEQLIPLRLNLELKVSVKIDGILSRKAPLQDDCLVKVACVAECVVYFNLLAIHMTEKGPDVTSLYPDETGRFPKPDGDPPCRRLEWPNEPDRLFTWQDSRNGTVTFILLAYAEKILVEKITTAVPLGAPPELHGTWSDEFEPMDLAAPAPAKPSTYRHFTGQTKHGEKAAAQWHRWLAEEMMLRSSVPPLAVACHSRPFVC